MGPFLSSESTHEGYDRRVGREIAFCLQESSSLGQRSVDSHSVRARVDDPQRSSRQPVVCIHMLGQFLMSHSAKINRASTDRSRDQWKTPSGSMTSLRSTIESQGAICLRSFKFS